MEPRIERIRRIKEIKPRVNTDEHCQIRTKNPSLVKSEVKENLFQCLLLLFEMLKQVQHDIYGNLCNLLLK